MAFQKEADFEEALVQKLLQHGWQEVLQYPTEQDLLDNWARILFQNNNTRDRLNGYPLTQGEMEQIIEQIRVLGSSCNLNTFINGKSIAIKRDHPQDVEHLDKEISLKIFDKHEISAGQSTYQIAQQPIFARKIKELNDRRGDVMLLINGMPVIHIELKRSGIPISQAYHQIEKYAQEGLFTGLFALVQVFVAMTPEDMLYFANPGAGGIFNPAYYFRWADINNEPIREWDAVVSSFLHIPMAHELIGFYTIADASDGVLKVMRSYQYHAANSISDKVAKNKWNEKNQHGGYVWHTTGSGKTMTSFKSAQLIADSNHADKVIFLVDRIELGTQSLGEYRGFAGDAASDDSTVQETENTYQLIATLRSTDSSDRLIVTSIQKMSRINMEEDALKADDITAINQKRLVFIVDECHRSTFGDMLSTIKTTFPYAIFFGFTGTPIHDENNKKDMTTAQVFGNELCRYSIADGISDHNVLGFDVCQIKLYRDKDLREMVALQAAKATCLEEVFADPAKEAIYYHYLNTVPMAGEKDAEGNEQKGIEDFLPYTQFLTPAYQRNVVQNIVENWQTLSRNNKFHAIFATSSIPEAIDYYRLFKAQAPHLKTTCLFDPHIDNSENFAFKSDGLVEILQDYNARYGTNFSLPTHAWFKKNVALRLAHKELYKNIESDPCQQLDLLIVVDQMLTGFDSKWINTLYLDKMLQFEGLIQAFSRTNRLFGPDKPFGTIRYYRKPHTMAKRIEAAVKAYSGDKPFGIYVDKLPTNIQKMNDVLEAIRQLFWCEDALHLESLPEDEASIAKFATLFNQLNDHLESAKIQGFTWDKTVYSETPEGVEDTEDATDPCDCVIANLDEATYMTLVQRYKEIPQKTQEEKPDKEKPIPYDLRTHITEIDTGRIDTDYMNSRFEKYIKLLYDSDASKEHMEQTLAELHQSFATLSQEDQKYAKIFLHDIERGDRTSLEEGKTFRDYITEYKVRAKQDQIHQFAVAFGMEEDKLRKLMDLHPTKAELNAFGRFDALKKTVSIDTAKAYLEQKLGKPMSSLQTNLAIDKFLRSFILQDGFALQESESETT